MSYAGFPAGVAIVRIFAKKPIHNYFFDYISECILTGNCRVYQFTLNIKSQDYCKHKRQIYFVIISQKKSLIKDIIKTEHIYRYFRKGAFYEKDIDDNRLIAKKFFQYAVGKGSRRNAGWQG